MKTLLIRAEDKNIWERRSPLVPNHVADLLRAGCPEIYVEKSTKRAFSGDDYVRAGARLCDDMSPGDVILGVKEIPKEKLIDNKIYLFFSHVIKGQAGNMPMLKRILQSGSTLIDYERIADDQNRRLIFFGNFAGQAGAIDILWLMGQYWRQHGLNTPFTRIQQALNYPSAKEATRVLSEVGDQIEREGLPPTLCPMVIGIMGYGNVSEGAQEIFDCLPIKRIEPRALVNLAARNQASPNTVYLVVFKEEHLVRSRTGQTFELPDYYQHPEHYVSQFDKYLPHLTILVNALYWDQRYPRFVTWEALRRLYEDATPPKLSGIADISCDVNGAVACNIKSTNPGQPAYLCDPERQTAADGWTGEGIVVLAVDNLPCELAFDSSIFFSDRLKAFLPNILNADYTKPLDESGLKSEIQQAVIVYNGELTPDYRYLTSHLAKKPR